MQVDVSQPKSRAFNVYLRLLQLGLSLILGTHISQLDSDGCSSKYYKILTIASYAIAAISLLAIISLRCKQNFPKAEFFIVFAIEIILGGIVVVISFVGVGQNNICANNKVLYAFAGVETVVFVLVCLVALLLPFYWVQRYTNSPGNFTWPILLFWLSFKTTYTWLLVLIGLMLLVVSLLTLASNLFAGLKGITTGVKKCVVIFWAVCLILMIVAQILGIVGYLKNSQNTQFHDVAGKKLLLIFLAVNILDFIFWIIGLMTLQYENGDKIRDALLVFGKTDQYEDEGQQPQYGEEAGGRGIGTIK